MEAEEDQLAAFRIERRGGAHRGGPVRHIRGGYQPMLQAAQHQGSAATPGGKWEPETVMANRLVKHWQVIDNAHRDKTHKPILPGRHPFPHRATRLYRPLPHLAYPPPATTTAFIEVDHTIDNDSSPPPMPTGRKRLASGPIAHTRWPQDGLALLPTRPQHDIPAPRWRPKIGHEAHTRWSPC